MLRATQFAHELIQQAVKPGDKVVDATVGNGHDTIFLARLVGESGRVWGFDIQHRALAEAAKRIGDMRQVTLLHAGHETLTAALSSYMNQPPLLSAVMFNLGYLPGADDGIKTRKNDNAPVITEAKTTLAGLEQALTHLAPRGVMTMILYPGHKGGDEEARAVRDYTSALPTYYEVNRFARMNSANPAPELIAIERLK